MQIQDRERKIIVILLAFLFFCSSTGVVFHRHICGCAGNPVDKLSASGLPVLFSMEPDSIPVNSCCHENEIDGACLLKGITDFHQQACDHCRDEIIYLKAPIISVVPIIEKVIHVSLFENPDLVLLRLDDLPPISKEGRAGSVSMPFF